MEVLLFKIIRLTGPTKRNGLAESINEQNYNVDGLTKKKLTINLHKWARL